MQTGLANNLPATVALVGVGLTAAVASLRFFLEKSAKITDFRKAWIETLRTAVSEFSANTHAIAGRVAIRTRHSVTETPKSQSLPYFLDDDDIEGAPRMASLRFDQEFESGLLPQWVALRLAYNKAILHLNPHEHAHYLRAEMAIADYYRIQKDKANELAVNAFLRRCLDYAYAGLRSKVGALPVPPGGMSKPEAPPADRAGRKADGAEVDDGGLFSSPIQPPEALLLAMFATRQLLHGPYPTLHTRMADIEHGIRVVDSAAAIVIKFVWREIKNGEPGYRKISWASLGLSVLVLGVVCLALLWSSFDTRATRNIECSIGVLRLPPPFFGPGVRCAVRPAPAGLAPTWPA